MKRTSYGLTLILALAACGGGEGGAGDSTTTLIPLTTTTTAGTSTSVATTTAPTTGIAATDAHPLFGVSWASVFPDEGETAIYRVTRFDGSTADLPAAFEYGVDFRGTTVDRLVVGTAAPGNEGWALYFDRSEPWVFAVIASEVYDPAAGDGPSLTEFFPEPIPFDGTIGVGETFTIESRITLEFAGGGDTTLDVTYEMRPASIEETITVPFGTVDEVLLLDAEVGGAFIGGLFPVRLWLHPDHALVRFEGAPAWELIELVETWG